MTNTTTFYTPEWYSPIYSLPPPSKWFLPPIAHDGPVAFVFLWNWCCFHMELPQRMQHGNSLWPLTPPEAGWRASRSAKHLWYGDACHLVMGQRKAWTGSSEFTKRLASLFLQKACTHLSSCSFYFGRLAFQLAGECYSFYFELPLKSPLPFKDFSSTSFE